MCFEEFHIKYGLNVDILTYSGCVQAVKKYIKGLNTDVQSNNSSNMRKSITITCKVQKQTKGYDILFENESKSKVLH